MNNNSFKPDDADPTNRLLYWIAERDSILKRKEADEPRPWTSDPILAKYSFCNVRRESDRVTRWLTKNWREPHVDDPDFFFAAVVARFVNLLAALDAIGYPVPWNPDHFVEVMAARKASGEKTEGPAYMIPAPPQGGLKPPFLARSVFDPIWNRRAILRPRDGDSLASFAGRLQSCHLLGGFLTGQVIADTKFVEPLLSARDWWTWAISGPGSRRGMNRLQGRPVDAGWQEDVWWRALDRLRLKLEPHLQALGIGRLCAQDTQNTLCEFDKYERTRLGEGKPKRRYEPFEEQGSLFSWHSATPAAPQSAAPLLIKKFKRAAAIRARDSK